MPDGQVVIVGGTSGIGLALAQHYAAEGADVVVTGRDLARAETTAGSLGGTASACCFDLADPLGIREALEGVGPVRRLVLAAIERDENTVRDYDVARALRLVTLKLVGYTEVVHALASRLGEEASIVIFGGLAKDRPYPGSTTVSTVNGGVGGLMRALAVELAPVRVNVVHPGIVGDSPAWRDKPREMLAGIESRTPTGRLASMEDVVDAVVFLLENRSVNGTELYVHGGTLLT
jgi:NAD(P)-dependent dehydrogenase (short-subunit alcohol dehydrogenase family)